MAKQLVRRQLFDNKGILVYDDPQKQPYNFDKQDWRWNKMLRDQEAPPRDPPPQVKLDPLPACPSSELAALAASAGATAHDVGKPSWLAIEDTAQDVGPPSLLAIKDTALDVGPLSWLAIEDTAHQDVGPPSGIAIEGGYGRGQPIPVPAKARPARQQRRAVSVPVPKPTRQSTPRGRGHDRWDAPASNAQPAQPNRMRTPVELGHEPWHAPASNAQPAQPNRKRTPVELGHEQWDAPAPTAQPAHRFLPLKTKAKAVAVASPPPRAASPTGSSCNGYSSDQLAPQAKVPRRVLPPSNVLAARRGAVGAYLSVPPPPPPQQGVAVVATASVVADPPLAAIHPQPTPTLALPKRC